MLRVEIYSKVTRNGSPVLLFTSYKWFIFFPVCRDLVKDKKYQVYKGNETKVVFYDEFNTHSSEMNSQNQGTEEVYVNAVLRII